MGPAVPWRRVWAIRCVVGCGGVLGAFLVQGERNEPMPPFRRIPRLFLHRIARAIFVLLWAAVLLVRCGAVDHRALQGNPARNAPRPPLAEEVM